MLKVNELGQIDTLIGEGKCIKKISIILNRSFNCIRNYLLPNSPNRLDSERLKRRVARELLKEHPVSVRKFAFRNIYQRKNNPNFFIKYWVEVCATN